MKPREMLTVAQGLDWPRRDLSGHFLVLTGRPIRRCPHCYAPIIELAHEQWPTPVPVDAPQPFEFPACYAALHCCGE